MKRKYSFYPRDLIFLGLALLYAICILVTGACIESSHTLISKRNILNKLAGVLNFPQVEASLLGYVGLVLIAVYLVLFVAAVLYIRRYAIGNGVRPWNWKPMLGYVAVLVLCVALSVGLTFSMLSPKTPEHIQLVFGFLGYSIALGSLTFLFVAAAVGAMAMLVANLLFPDKPIQDAEEFSIVDDSAQKVATYLSAGNAGEASGMLADRAQVFPALTAVDIAFFKADVPVDEEDEIADEEDAESRDLEGVSSLEELCTRFRNYLAGEKKLYFSPETIRFFVSAFAVSPMMILEGLSGTGKSSLPRCFAEFIDADVVFTPVQSTWRDQTNLLGFFNEFSKTYTETDFLVHLYRANHAVDRIHIFVLDEMNISRVEYYFADFLSVLEYPQSERKLRLMQIPHGFLPPEKLADGNLSVPANCLFVGTANKDDSTFPISDKVYDRAITLNFRDRNRAFEASGSIRPISMSATQLQALYTSALSNAEAQLTEEDYERIELISSFVRERFDLTFGNRILNQIDRVVPVVIACGGTREEALDFLLAQKVLSKLEGRFEEHVKESLQMLLRLLQETFGAGVFQRSEQMIRSLIGRL